MHYRQHHTYSQIKNPSRKEESSRFGCYKKYKKKKKTPKSLTISPLSPPPPPSSRKRNRTKTNGRQGKSSKIRRSSANEWDQDHELKCRLGIRGQSLSLYFRRPLTNHISSKVGRARTAPYRRPLIEMQPARKQLLGVDHELNIGTYLLAGVFHRWRKF